MSTFVLSVCLQDKEPRGIIPLENLSIREVDEPRKPVSDASKARLHSMNLIYTYTHQGWKVQEHFVTVLLLNIFRFLYFYFSGAILLLLLTFVYNYIYFLLLTVEKRVCSIQF